MTTKLWRNVKGVVGAVLAVAAVDAPFVAYHYLTMPRLTPEEGKALVAWARQIEWACLNEPVQLQTVRCARALKVMRPCAFEPDSCTLTEVVEQLRDAGFD